jgi:hypothetical protein
MDVAFAKDDEQCPVPRWFASQSCDEEETDSYTGLPIATLSGPPELAASNEAFIRGFNDEIHRARSAGEFTIDFRPLLLSRGEVLEAFRTQRLGTLSLDCRQIEDPRGRFIVKLQLPKPRKGRQRRTTRSEPLTWIVFVRAGARETHRLMLYDSPVEFALGRDGHVVLMKTTCLYLTFDAETTQDLQCFRLADHERRG